MRIGNCVVEIYIPEISSLKGKRNVLKGLKNRIRNRFNVSVSEIDRNDNHRVSILAITTVSNNKKFVDKILTSVIRFMGEQRQIEIINYKMEIL